MANINDMDNIRRIAENQYDFKVDAQALRESLSNDSLNLERTAQNTEDTVYQFEQLNHDLEKERTIREKEDKFNRFIAVSSLIVAILSLIISLFK